MAASSLERRATDRGDAMVTVAQARTIALSMPLAEEREHMSHPDFRIGGKIFATLLPDKSRAVVKLSAADQSALVQMDPEAFSLNAWSHQGFTSVDLKRVGAARLRSVVEAAWRNVAPKKLLQELGRD
jgi:hypothetical protein